MEPVDNSIYLVKGETKDLIVSLIDTTYTCRRFNLSLILCLYSCAAIRYVYNYFLYLHMLYYIIVIKITYSICLHVFRSARKRIDRFVSSYYKKETFVATYSGILYLVCHPDEWDVLESVRSVVVNPLI